MVRSPVWSCQVLGEVTLTYRGRDVGLTAAKPRLLLALLAIRPNQIVTSDQLIEELWEAAPPASARTLLQGYVSDLRKLIEPERARRAPARVLRTQPHGYMLVCAPAQVDADAFAGLVRQGRGAFQHGDLGAARRHLEDALALWRGAPFGSLGEVPALVPHRAGLEELHVSAVEDRVMLDLRQGRDTTLVTELEGLVAAHPLRERLWAALMLALYRRGRQAEALAAYQRIVALLRDELGADPGAELVRTHQAILRHDRTLDPQPAPARLRPPPRPTTALIGRRDQLRRLTDAIRERRLVTLVGSAGCGKTRLAQEVATSLDGPSAVAWVDLAPARRPGDVAATTLTAIGEVEQPDRDPADTLAAQIADRDLVLVLDNCEHQLPACRELTAKLLARCASLRVLATSRMALRVRGETRWPVPPLTAPVEDADFEAVADSDAVRLFVDRSRDAEPAFRLTDENAAHVSAVVRRLEGIPLAIELAAAWAGVLPVSVIADQLAAPLDFLTRGSPTAPTRQRTLRATIEWSHRLLGEEDRRVFAQLSVFAGAFSLDAARQICEVASTDDATRPGAPDEARNAILDRLANLQSASMLVTAPADRGKARFRMLDTLRAFAHEQLEASGRATQVRDRHARYVHALARRAEAGLYGPDLKAWLERLDENHADLRSALEWSLSSGSPDVALDTAGALLRFWMARAHMAEGRRWLQRALDADTGRDPSARVRALLAASFLASLHYDADAAQQAADEALAIVRAAGHVRGTAWALGIKAFAAVMDADPRKAIAAAAAVPDLPGLDDPLPRAWALNFMALAHQAGGQYEQERHALTQALELSREAGDPMGVEWALGYGGSAAHALGRHADALAMLNESLDISTRIGNRWGMARNLAAVALATDDDALRHQQMRESLRTFGRLGDRAGIAFCLRVIGSWLGEVSSSERAAAVMTTADQIGADVRHVPVLGHLSLAQPAAGNRPGHVDHARPLPVHTALTNPTIEDAVTMGLTALDELDEMASARSE